MKHVARKASSVAAARPIVVASRRGGVQLARVARAAGKSNSTGRSLVAFLLLKQARSARTIYRWQQCFSNRKHCETDKGRQSTDFHRHFFFFCLASVSQALASTNCHACCGSRTSLYRKSSSFGEHREKKAERQNSGSPGGSVPHARAHPKERKPSIIWPGPAAHRSCCPTLRGDASPAPAVWPSPPH